MCERPGDNIKGPHTINQISLNMENIEPKHHGEQPDGKKLWIIKSIVDDVEYKIWAHTYQQALELLPMIESF